MPFNISDRANRVVALIVLLSLTAVSATLLIRMGSQEPIGLKFVHVLLGKDREFYSREWNTEVRAGGVLWRTAAILERYGLPTFRVDRIRWSCAPDKVVVVLGFDGDFATSPEVSAAIVADGERIPLESGLHTLEGTTKHMLFCVSKSLSALPKGGVFVLSNSISGSNFYTRKF